MTSSLSGLQSQFMGAFFEESFESLELLETGLLRMEAEGLTSTDINDIFRAAHSIKGSAGTFGFQLVTELAHDMETLLDLFRAGHLVPRQSSIALLLSGVDALRQVLTASRDGGQADHAAIAPLRQRLQDATREDASAGAEATEISPSAATTPLGASPPVSTPVIESPSLSPWIVSFKPNADLLRTGNEPLRLLRELTSLGTAQVETDFSRLPEWDDIVVDDCYLSFTVRLIGAIDRAQIVEVFGWVEEDAKIEISEPVQLAPILKGEAESPALPNEARPSPAPHHPRAPQATAQASEVAGEAAGQTLASVRVGIDRIDALMNMVGELIITQSMLGELDDDGPIDAKRAARIREGLSQLARNTRGLQENVMRLRSMPLSVVFNRFQRLVHDLAQQLGKKIDLTVSGQNTELDKTVLEKLGDPLVHLVRNSLDHGLETPAERIAAGKPETGNISLSAIHRGSDIYIEVADDGRGLDTDRILARGRERGLVAPNAQPTESEIFELIFAPGFSTNEVVTELSGRGVGMDVVRRNVRALGGSIKVESVRGKGAKISLRLPMTLAIIDGQLIRIGDRPFVLPLLSIVESLQIQTSRIHPLSGGCDLYRLRDELIPMVEVGALLGIDMGAAKSGDSLLVIVEAEGERLGLMVDELQAQQQVVVKSLEANYERVLGLAGATILGDGNVAFILDVADISKLIRKILPKGRTKNAIGRSVPTQTIAV